MTLFAQCWNISKPFSAVWAKACIYSARASALIFAWSLGHGGGWSGRYKRRWFLETGWRHWLACQLFYWGGWPRLSAGKHFSPYDGLFTALALLSFATSSEPLPNITWSIMPHWPFSHLNQIISTLCLISVAKTSDVFTWVCRNNISPWESCWMGKQAAIKQSLENR